MDAAHPGTSIKLRLGVAASILGAYLAAPIPLLLTGREGIWLVTLLLACGLPLLLIAIVSGLVFAERIVRSPWTWSLAAGVGAILASCTVLGLWTGMWTLGLASAPIALLGPIIFRGTLHLFQD